MRAWLRIIWEDLRGEATEQSRWRISAFNFGEQVRAKLLPFLGWVASFLALGLAVSLVFAVRYASIVASYSSADEISVEVSFKSVVRDSFLIFENLPVFTESGQPEFMDAFNVKGSENDLSCVDEDSRYAVFNELSVPMFVERVLGVVINALLIAAITSVALAPINPIWLSPCFLLDTSYGKYGALVFRYWIRYPEDKWLYRFALTVRFLSDRADRSMENRDEILCEDLFERVMRRGVCEYKIPLEKDGGRFLSALSRIAVDCYGEGDREYRIWDWPARGLTTRRKHTNPDNSYADYQINCRVLGTTDDGHIVASEKKYNIRDMLFGYSYMPPDVPERVAALTHEDVVGLPWHEPKKYKYFYRNVWKVTPANKTVGFVEHVGMSVEELQERGIDGTLLLAHLERLAKQLNGNASLQATMGDAPSAASRES